MTGPVRYPNFKSEDAEARWRAAYDTALAAWPVPVETRKVPTALGATSVLASGPPDAPPVILLPSFAATALVWRANIAALAASRRVYAVDTIGQSGMSFAERKLEGPDDYAAWLCAVMDGLAVSKAAVIGCSFGAYIAASQALRHPDRVERLALIGPAGVYANMSPLLALKMITGPLRRRIARLFGNDGSASIALNARQAPRHAGDDAWRALMGVTMAIGSEMSVTNTRVFAAQELARLTLPVLLLIGEYEQLYDPAAIAARARRLTPNLTAHVVPGADHIAAMAQPEAVNAHLLRFLETPA